MSDLLTTRDMARFVARGVLEFPELVPDEVNRAYLNEVDRGLPVVAPGTPLADAFPAESSAHSFVNLPQVAAVIESLVGPDSVFDHHFTHVALPSAQHEELGFGPPKPQHFHQDSTIDTRTAFDLQLMWYPQEVTAGMGGTRYLPGSHLRVVSEAAVGRYQNIAGQKHVVCPAGTVLALHHGIWHGGGRNTSDRVRHMYKVRLNPSVPQIRLWDDRDLSEDDFAQRPIFYTGSAPDPDHLHAILLEGQPWYEADTGRLELLNRVRLWRHVLGDDEFDADYWMTRIENEPRGAGV